MAKALELIPKDWTTDVGNGEVVVTIKDQKTLDELSLRRDDGSLSKVGDVLSIQPDGTFQTRPSGTADSFERAKIQGNVLVYRPNGSRAWVPFGIALDWPNR